MIIALVFIFIFYIVLIEPNLITVKYLTLKSEDIKKLKIVFVSDFHLSKTSGGRLQKIVNAVNKENPDIIISGGDYVIMHNAKVSMNMEKAAKILAGMRSKYGIYSVLGNHDYNKDGEYIKKSLIKEGIKILENSNEIVRHGDSFIYIAGISDMQTTYYDLDKALKETKPPVILVSHSPDIMPSAKGRVNLILSGHTHGGQIRIPFYGAVIVPSKYGKRFESGFIENLMYVTKGLGTSIIKARFNCPPEITVIEYI